MNNENKRPHRGNLFFANLLIGIIFIIPAIWLHSWVIDRLTDAGNPPQAWVENVTGILAAILPALILVLFSARFLEKK
ncbi:hypothetical protein P0Y35_17920 [Kiritimatiellaeota bacterium B1221]|nr:hypothetical protein [Kiritimatiellaeota bacterium B1221]